MNWRVIWEFAGFQAVWLSSAFGAAQGSNAAGLAAAGVFVALQCVRRPTRAMILATLASGVLGALVESFFAETAVLGYAAPWPSPQFAPAWIVGLWLAFGTTLATTVELLGSRALLKAFLLGAVFGPLSYLAGAKIGALVITTPEWIGFGAIAAAWALVFPALVAFQRWLDPTPPT